MQREMTEAEKEERISRDPLAQVIVELTKAMKADFGRQYASQFKTKEDLDLYKRRVYIKLRGMDINDIADGYELYVDSGKTFCPGIPELMDFANQAARRRKNLINAEQEINRVAALPAPTIECNPLQLLAEAKQNVKQAKSESREDKLKAHNVMLNLHYNKIRHFNYQPEHKCAVSNCNKIGAHSSNTKGGGPYYCIEHQRQLD